MQKREQWIDLARGILILMVVFFHLPILTRSLANNLETLVVMQVSSIYLPFFIPAFFVITGMCSNFSYIVKDFVISNTKHLIIPMLSLSFFARVIGWNIYDWSDFCSVEGWSYAVVGYFILSLLISKSIYYFLHFINLSLYWRGLITLLLLLLVIVMNKCGIYNFLYFENALIFTFFIWLGDFLRNIHWERYAKYSLLVYLLLYVCMYVCMSCRHTLCDVVYLCELLKDSALFTSFCYWVSCNYVDCKMFITLPSDRADRQEYTNNLLSPFFTSSAVE